MIIEIIEMQSTAERFKFVDSMLQFYVSFKTNNFKVNLPKNPKRTTREKLNWKRKGSNGFTRNDITRCLVTRTINIFVA